LRELLAPLVGLVKTKSITEFNSKWKGDLCDGGKHVYYYRQCSCLIPNSCGLEGQFQRRPGHTWHNPVPVHDSGKNPLAADSGGAWMNPGGQGKSQAGAIRLAMGVRSTLTL